MTKKIDGVDERVQYCHAKLRDEIADAKSPATCDQALVAQNTDQCLTESLAPVAKESGE